MPVEIRDLLIKATVQNAVATPETTVTAAADPTTNLNEIVATCVEQVLAILKEKEER
jgi:hypothetical protein